VLGLAIALLRPPADTLRPGITRLLSGALVEMLLSILIAPIFMLTQTRAIIEILLGRDSGWSAQRRDGEAPALSQLLRFHAGHLMTGVALAVVCLLASLYVAAWMGPIIAGLLLSVGISHVTARSAPGWLAKALATPEDIKPPAIVAAVGAIYPDWRALLAKDRRA
jgi:membrane glycosyltransferase